MSKKLNRRRLGKAIKRLQNLPSGSNFFLYTFNKFRHFFYKAIKSTKVAYPSTVMLELSNLCNLQCTTCPREYDYGKDMAKGLMKLEQAKQIVDQVTPYIDSIGLTGMGETLIFKELSAIIDYIRTKNSGIIISFSTNAMLPNFIEIVQPMLNKVDTIQISIDGIGQIYENIRINASFEKLNENLQKLTKLCQNTTTELILNMVVTKENYMQIPDLVRYSDNIGIKYLNFTLLNLAAITNTSTDYYNFYHSKEFGNTLRDLKRTVDKTPNVVVTNWDYKRKNEFQKCDYPWTHFYISWDGYLTPCCAKPFPKLLNFGNVFEEKFISLLNSKKYRAFRKMWFDNSAPEFCNKCNYIDLKPVK